MEITQIKGREIFDSRGDVTIEVDCIVGDKSRVSASVPSGAFAGRYEAVPTKDIATAIRNIDGIISKSLIGKDPQNQQDIDQTIIELDGTPNKQSLGANTILGVSMAVARAGALSSSKTLVKHLQDQFQLTSSSQSVTPLFNIINGGAHADSNLSFQEFMIMPLNNDLSFREKMAQGRLVFSTLKSRLEQLGKSTNVGDEGGFAPELNSNEEAIEILIEAIEESKLVPGKDIGIALDIAAGGIPDLAIATYPRSPFEYYKYITDEYPVISIEDPYTDDAWEDWTNLTQAIGGRVSIVGDDLFTTNPERLKIGIDRKAGNAISIKPNQIGTVSETIQTIKLAQSANIVFQISHRSGETEDTFISDLAVASGAHYLKAGAPNRGERIAKYNQLIRLEEEN